MKAKQVKVKVLRGTVASGEILNVGEVVEISAIDARILINSKKVVEVKAKAAKK